MNADQLRDRLSLAAFAFRGYNVSNLGRSRELLEHADYGPIVARHLAAAQSTCREVTGRTSDLERIIRDGVELGLEGYAESISLIVAMEQAQLEVLDTFFGISIRRAKVCLGYSLGEIAALVACGVIDQHAALSVPLSLAEDCVALAEDVNLGIVISRGPPLPLDTIRRLCIRVNQLGRGVMGISAYLSPNSLLVMGQGETLDCFRDLLREVLPKGVSLRRNPDRWPPLHTPIVWQRNIPNRSAELMHAMPGGLVAPQPPILSLVTGKVSYNDYNAREILHHWVDHPQRLWDAVYELLNMGIQTVVHVGPAPNIIPATLSRLRDNVEAQTRGSLGMRALSAVVHRPWLKTILPQRTALLRAPQVRQIILEDWLLAGGRVLPEAAATPQAQAS